MRSREKPPTPGWRRRDHRRDDGEPYRAPSTPEEARQQRLESCRLAWEQGQHFGALAEAVRLCAPPWVYEAVTGVLVTSRDRPTRLAQLWRRHEQDLVDRARHDVVDAALEIGFSWKRAGEYAAHDLQGTKAGQNVTAAAMLQSYHRVRRRQQQTPLRYYASPETRHYFPEDPPRPPDPMFLTKFPEVEQLGAERFLREWALDKGRTETELDTAARRLRISKDVMNRARRRLKIRVRAR